VLPSEIASIASTVSGLAATVSLIYVGIQIRLSVRHTRASIQQGTAARTTNILFGFMNAEAVAIWIEGNGGTPTPELVRASVPLPVRHRDDCAHSIPFIKPGIDG
jgi:hypothetical protein